MEVLVLEVGVVKEVLVKVGDKVIIGLLMLVLEVVGVVFVVEVLVVVVFVLVVIVLVIVEVNVLDIGSDEVNVIEIMVKVGDSVEVD